MNKNAICILANNMSFFKAMVDNFPTCIDDYDLIIVNEDRIGNRTAEIRNILGHRKYSLITATEIIYDFKNHVVDTSFVDSYTMGMNILMQWYVFRHFGYGKVLFLDEDIILTDKIKDVFELEYSAFYKFKLSNFDKSYQNNHGKRLQFINAMNDVFDLQLNDINYKCVVYDNHVNGGQRLYCKSDFDFNEYEYYLARFFKNKTIEYLWDNRRSHITYFIDERFEGFFAVKTGIINDDLKPYTQFEFRNPASIDAEKVAASYSAFEKKAIWHNLGTGHGDKWLKLLKDAGKIK